MFIIGCKAILINFASRLKIRRMKTLYLLGIYFYWFAARVASLFNPKAKQFVSGRRGLLERIESAVPADRKVIWFHCASVGEFEQARPVIEKFREKSPEFFIVLTFFSPSGYELRKNYDKADAVFYLPMDTPSNARKFVRSIHPDKAVFIKYEFWYFYLRELRKAGVSSFIISAIFRNDQHFFKWYGGFFRKMLGAFDTLFVQDDNSVSLLESIGIRNSVRCGDTRFDRVFAITRKPMDIPAVKDFKAAGGLVFVAGSTWPPDQEIIIRTLSEYRGKVRCVMVPHEIRPAGIAEIESAVASCGMKSVRYSAASAMDSAQRMSLYGDCDVLIVDNVGMLSSIYRYADFSYVGGGFGVGIHNVLEAAAYGIPVIFGPNYRKFREARELIALRGAFSVDGQAAFDRLFSSMVSDDSFRTGAGRTADTYVRDNLGATEIIMEKL